MIKDLIAGFVKDQIKNQINEKIGLNLDDKGGALDDVIGSLVGGLAKNASNSEGANSLVNALDKDHDGSILEDAFELMQSEDKGQAILKHILGDKLSGMSELIGTKNGIDSAQIQKLLAILAPIVMGYLGKKKKEEGLGVDTLVELLIGEKTALSQDPAESPLLAFLDKDGDGDVDMMDLLKMAS